MEEYGFFEYKIEYWDEIQKKMTTACGVTYASTFTEAVDKIEQYYDKIEDITIFSLEPYSVYEFNEEQNNFKIKKEDKDG